MIGKGKHSSVFREKLEGSEVAVKKVQNKKFGFHEAKLLQELKHPNVVELISYLEENIGVSLFLELINQNLWEFVLNEGHSIGKELFKNLAIQMTSALVYLHNSSIIHHDIKPHNILINQDRVIKLCDFGSSVFCKNGDYLTDGLGRGTTVYCAPEILSLEKYDHKIDVYSLGVVFWVMLTAKSPFEGIQSNPVIIRYIKEGNGFPIPQAFLDGTSIPFSFSSIVNSCLLVNPNDRPSSQSLLSDLNSL